jgi:hypothetical protein
MAASVILLEAAPLNAATGFAQTVRLAGGGARQPYYYGGQHWRAGIVRLPTFITSISFEGADFGEGGVPQAAELQWAPSTKADLATLAGYFWIDAPVTVHIGPENAAGALPPLRLTGKVLSTSVEDGTLKIQLSDPAAGLKKPLLMDRFGGTGGLFLDRRAGDSAYRARECRWRAAAPSFDRQGTLHLGRRRHAQDPTERSGGGS